MDQDVNVKEEEEEWSASEGAYAFSPYAVAVGTDHDASEGVETLARSSYSAAINMAHKRSRVKRERESDESGVAFGFVDVGAKPVGAPEVTHPADEDPLRLPDVCNSLPSELSVVVKNEVPESILPDCEEPEEDSIADLAVVNGTEVSFLRWDYSAPSRSREKRRKLSKSERRERRALEGGGPWLCETCGLGFGFRRTFRRHVCAPVYEDILSSEEESPPHDADCRPRDTFQPGLCEHCGASLPSGPTLSPHLCSPVIMQIRSVVQPAFDAGLLRIGIDTETPPPVESYPCDSFSDSFKREHSLIAHKEPFPCGLCVAHTGSQAGDRTLRGASRNAPAETCADCGSRKVGGERPSGIASRTRRACAAKGLNVSDGSSSRVCGSCGSGLDTRRNLHPGDGKLTCFVCKARFKLKSLLASHQLGHRQSNVEAESRVPGVPNVG